MAPTQAEAQEEEVGEALQEGGKGRGWVQRVQLNWGARDERGGRC